MTLKGMVLMAFALVALGYMFIAFALMYLAERYIPERWADKLDRLFGFEEVKENESDRYSTFE